MLKKWNKKHYLLTEIAEKLSCNPSELIHFGLSGKLKIAAYIFIETDKIKTYSLYEGNYTYSSGYYYICPQQLKHFEFKDYVDNIQACDIIPTNTYKDDNLFFYLHSDCIERYAKSEYSNITEESHCFSGEVYFINDEYIDSHDIASMKNKIVNETKSEEGKKYSNDEINFLASPSFGTNYTINCKDLFIYHNDLMQFFQNEELYHDELESLKNDKIISESTEITSLKRHKKDPIQSSAPQKGGKPKAYLAEAVEFTYKKLLNEKNINTLQQNNVKAFLMELHKLADEKGNKNFEKYVADRIERVKISPKGCTVTTKEQFVKVTQTREIIDKIIEHKMTKISKLLCKLRKDFPLPK